MKKSRKFFLIVFPIVILIGISLSLPSFQDNNFIESKIISEKFTTEDFDALSSSMVVGSSDASVTILAFNDYQCVSCKYWYENEYPKISKDLIETKKSNIIFLDSPPEGNDSILISQATFCADEQGKYSEYQKQLFASQLKVDTWAKSEQLKRFANDLNLDGVKFGDCLDSEKFKNKVLDNIKYATNLGVDKIPIFKIINQNGEEHILKGGLPSDIFETTVNRLQ